MNLDLRFYWKLLIRRFPVMALLITLSAGLAVFTAMRLPETFATSARLLVEEPQIPNSMVVSTVQTGAVEQLDIIQQRLLTRANLIDIANRFDVYEDLGNVDPDTVVTRMKQDTTIRRSTGRDSATLMTISFRGRNGQIVANVVNEYVTLVLEANLEFRLGRAESALDFFDREVEQLGNELESQAVMIAAFKSENSEALPENQTYRLGRQSLLQERLSNLERDLRTLVAQRSDIERIFETTGQLGSANIPQEQQTPEQAQLVVAQTDLQQALLTYSEENPRVIRLQQIVDRLEAIVATQNANAVSVIEDDEEPLTPAEALFEATIIEIDNRADALAADIETTQNELDGLQLSISESAVNGIELSALEREFDAIQTRYNSAVSNLDQAQMSERIETTAQGQRITVIENANVPRTPSGPNRTRIVALGVAVGLALAGGFWTLLELLNRSIRRPAEIISRFNVTPIATIPYIESRGRRGIRRLFLIIGSLIALAGVPYGLWYIDTNYIPLDFLVQKVLTRIGLM